MITPGPWIVSPESDREVIAPRGLAGAELIGKAEPLGENFVERWPETVANARVMAAAPELLAALEEAAETLEFAGLDDHCNMYGAANRAAERTRSVIAKAKKAAP